MNEPTFGCDPEFFLVNGSGKCISAIELVPGDKHKPHLLSDGAGLQTDNVAIEFASRVFTNPEDMIEHIQKTVVEIRSMLPEGLSISNLPSAEFEEAELDHPQARLFGCSPDYNAWTMRVNNPPDPDSVNFRSCGGHIHVGDEDLSDVSQKALMVKLMDCFHGLVATMLDDSPESIARRQLYGKAGCHRPTSYGVEYRVLSNYWLKHLELVRLQFSMVEDCLSLIKGGSGQTVVDAVGGEVVETINNGDFETATSLVSTHIMAHMSDKSKKLFSICAGLNDVNNLEEVWS